MAVGRTLRTLRHLRTRQIAYYIWRRLLPAAGAPVRIPSSVARRAGVRLLPRPCSSTRDQDAVAFSFVGQTLTFEHGAIDWHPAEVTRLWRYNLHYFEYLRDEARPRAVRDHFIDDWIANNPLGTEDAWEPYTASLRIVNWTDYFFRTDGGRALKPAWIRSLYQQALWLERNIEYHILANHYLKNAVAMLFAGGFFAGSDGERWLALGIKILREEAEEQMLADGGHYERSPMYHAIVCQDFLDAVNLLSASGIEVRAEVIRLFENKAEAGVQYLLDILHPDGEIPLFNDAAFDIAPRPADLVAYAERITGRTVRLPQQGPALIEKRETGYYGLRSGGDFFIVDCGPIGPDYQPGHGHCDTLSFELSIDGRRVVVDSGTYGYENDELRAYLRSTAAHNTVKVEATEQSELWSTFRAGRRARPIEARIACDPSGDIVFTGVHDGYRHLHQRVMHERTLRCSTADSTWRVTDKLSGKGVVRAESYLHFAPGLTLREEGFGPVVVDRQGSTVIAIETIDADEITLSEAPYCSRFGERVLSAVVIFMRRAKVPFEIGYVLRKVVR